MVSVRRKKMARSSVSKNTRRLKDKQRQIKIFSNPIIKENWDENLTLQQNYKRLGLRAKLGHIAGGIEKPVEKFQAKSESNDKQEASAVKPEDIEQTDDPSKIPEGEARIIRDPETDEVIKVIYGTMKQTVEQNELQDSSVIKQLEEQAIKNAAIVKERKQSEREVEWIKKLYEKHGDDYNKMMWDKKLNIYQQSAGDLKRRVTKWKKANGL